jgi:hypothetical protein
MPRVYQITLIYVAQVHPEADGAYPEGEALGRELARKAEEAFDQTGDRKGLDPEQYELIDEEAD